MVRMRGWSFPIGRFLGVDVRIHTFFLLLLGLSISYASVAGATGTRGFALWLLLLLAVLVREAARAVGAAWFGLDIRSILLLPTGGLFSYASSEATEKAETPEMQKRMAVIGPIANIGFGLLLVAHMEDQGLLLQTDVDAVRMRDVMLTQFSMLSASDTLEDALQWSVHTLQDVFPVVRGANLVGAVSRQSIVEALHTDGNGYV